MLEGRYLRVMLVEVLFFLWEFELDLEFKLEFNEFEVVEFVLEREFFCSSNFSRLLELESAF